MSSLRYNLHDMVNYCRGFQLSLTPKVRIKSMRFGDYDSIHKGEGFDFEDLREYAPGDSLRKVHTPSSSRYQKLMVVQRKETREVRVLVILDLSRSMYIRENLESALAMFFMTSLSAIKLHMPVGLVAFADDFELEVWPRLGDGHFYRIVDLLTETVQGRLDPEKEAFTHEKKISGIIDYWHKFLPGGSTIFVVSDFLGENNACKAVIEEELYKFRVLPVVIQDDLQYSFPVFPRSGSFVEFLDVEEEAVKQKWINKRQSLKIKAVHETRFEALTQWFVKKNFRYVHLESFNLAQIYQRLEAVLV